MTIARLEAFTISTPRTATAGAGGWNALRVSTDSGATGWGEGPVMSTSAWAAAVGDAATTLVGEDPERTHELVRRLRGTGSGTRPAAAAAAAALDTALHDLMSRTLDVPAHDLIGGRYREHVPVYAALPSVDPLGGPSADEALDAAIGTAIAAGFRMLKVRLDGYSGADVGRDRIGASARVIRRARERAGSGVELIVDVGFRSNIAAVVRLARAVEGFDVAWIEVDGLTPETLRTAASQGHIRLCHGSGLDRRGLLPFLEAHATDIVATDPTRNGLGELRRLTDLVSHFDAMSCASDAVGPLGLLTSLQACAALPGYERLGIDASVWSAMAETVDGQLTLEEGQLVVTGAPGLGAAPREERRVAIPLP